MYDLHVHSFYSDGSLSPEQIVERAKIIGLTGLALSDHDTVDGLQPMKEAAAKENLEIVPAVEFGTTWKKRNEEIEIHILGYFVDPSHKELNDTLETLKKGRDERVRQTVTLLRAFGIEILEEEVFDKKRFGMIGRGQIADVLLEKKYVQSAGEAFDRFIGAGKFAYVPKDILGYEEIIQLIHEAGGAAVCAHPKTMRNDSVLIDLVAAGLDGVEVINSKHNLKDVRHYMNMVQTYPHLIATAGSDCHGRPKRNGQLYLGRYTTNGRTVDDLRERAERYRTH